MGEKQFDVLLWGVTGWTGVHFFEYFVQNYPLNNVDEHAERWGVVARKEDKLQTVVNQIAEDYKVDWLDQVPKYLVDNSDEEKVDEVVKLTKVVATVVGPFAKFGETLLKACATNGTHYTDITAEYVWVRDMINKYNKVAEANGAFIIPSCGYDSVPSDIGTFLAVSEAHKIACSEFNMNYNDVIKSASVVKVNGYGTDEYSFGNRHRNMLAGGTIDSVFGIFEDIKSASGDPTASRYLTSEDDSNTIDDEHSPQIGVGYDDNLKLYTTFNPMSASNEKVVRRSRYLLPHLYGKVLSYKEAIAVKSMIGAYVVSVFARIGSFFSPRKDSIFWRTIRSWLPQPSMLPPPRPKENYDPGFFNLIYVCEASYKLNDETEEKLIKVRVDCKYTAEPSWAETSKILGESSLTLAKNIDIVRETSKVNGGVVTTASLGEVLVQRLRAKGISFTTTQL